MRFLIFTIFILCFHFNSALAADEDKTFFLEPGSTYSIAEEDLKNAPPVEAMAIAETPESAKEYCHLAAAIKFLDFHTKQISCTGCKDGTQKPKMYSIDYGTISSTPEKEKVTQQEAGGKLFYRADCEGKGLGAVMCLACVMA